MSDRFLNAFYFALKDNLVCQTIDIAQHTAFNLNKRHRVVTVGGDLFEPSGNISGGGQPKKGGMSSKQVEEFSEAQIQEAAEEVREKERNVTHCRSELQEIGNRLNQQTNQMVEIQRKMDALKMEMQNYQGFLKKEEQKVNKIKQQEQDFEEEVKKVDQLNQEMSEKSEQLKELTVQSDELKVKLDQKQAEIDEVGGEEYRKMKAELDTMNKKIADEEKLLIQNKATIDSSIENLKKLDDKIEKDDQKVEQMNEEKKELEDQVKGMEERAFKIMEER